MNNNRRQESVSISVAIACYNGMNYISEQLDTIRNQTLQPDEVIIADNKSPDGTYEFCKDYIAQHKLTGWRVFQNTHNIGIQKNFRRVLAECSGEYIFTCDHDDIWMPDKIASMVSVLKEHPEISLLTSNYIGLVNGKPAKVHMKYIDRDDGSVIPFRLQDSGLANLRPGCTFCFRRRLLEKFSVMDIGDALHDAMLWKYAIVSDSLYLLNRQLMYWRRHEHAATGVDFSARPNVDTRIRDAYGTEGFYLKFIDAAEGLDIPPANIKFMKEIIEFSHRRAHMLEKKKPAPYSDVCYVEHEVLSDAEKCPIRYLCDDFSEVNNSPANFTGESFPENRCYLAGCCIHTAAASFSGKS